MKLSCKTYAFDIRKRKLFREKDADLASFSLWGRKKEEQEEKMVKSFVFLQMERGQRSSSAGLRVQTGAWELSLLIMQGLICRGNCPISGIECRLAFPVTALSYNSLLVCWPHGCETDFAALCCVDQREELHQLHAIQEQYSGARRVVLTTAVRFGAFLDSPQLLHLRRNLSLHLFE